MARGVQFVITTGPFVPDAQKCAEQGTTQDAAAVKFRKQCLELLKESGPVDVEQVVAFLSTFPGLTIKKFDIKMVNVK